jgi:hypothetical protein
MENGILFRKKKTSLLFNLNFHRKAAKGAKKASSSLAVEKNGKRKGPER